MINTTHQWDLGVSLTTLVILHGRDISIDNHNNYEIDYEKKAENPTLAQLL